MRLPDLMHLSRRQMVIGGGAIGVGLIIIVGSAVAVLSSGGDDEEQLTEACLEPVASGEECETPDASLTGSATPKKSRTPSPTPTKSPKPTATAVVTLPTEPATVTAAPTTTPTAPPTAPGPVADAYKLTPLVSDPYLGSIGAIIEFAVMPGAASTGIVASQDGKIYKVSLNGGFAPQVWGNLSNKVTYGGEQGLLSVAFSPGYPGDARVYAYYTQKGTGRNTLSRFSASASALNAASEQVLLAVDDFAPNHNGGHIAFDSSGYLYLSLGDGGGGGDPEENGQDLTSLLGKVLRLNVSGNGGYTIPKTNPFNDGNGSIREEIFALGFRNPWRMTIDPQTNAVWLGDVGQGTWEEVDQVVVGGNYGWDCYEGAHSYEPDGCAGNFRSPRHEYDHSLGQAVTGGAVYRGSAMPELKGWYVFGDFYTGRIWAVNSQGSAGSVQLLKAPMNVSSFTLLPDGELAVVTYNTGVYRLAR